MDRTQDNRLAKIICGVLAIVTFAVFSPVLDHDFINFDDGTYVTENSMVQNGLTPTAVSWAFTTGYATNWHPLTWISHMIDCDLYGLRPAGHHLTGLLFHILNVVLLFRLLWRMTGALWRSAVVSALFAWHPMHIESVAWVAERKDVLSTLFWLLTMLAYWHYAIGLNRESSKSRMWYWLALLFFALGLMAKPMLVTLPFVLLLMDLWPLERIEGLQLAMGEPKDLQAPSDSGALRVNRKSHIIKLIWEKLPFLLLAAICSLVTFLVQNAGGAVAPLRAISFDQRFTNALVSYARYLGKMFWPTNLSVFYPMHPNWAAWQWIGSGLLVLLLTLMAIASLRRRPYFFVGWFWYVGTLVPVIGLVQVGGQSMADRYTYIPYIGMFIIVVWGLGDLLGRGTLRRLNPAWALIVPGLLACVAVTATQLKYWKDSITIFQHAVDVTSNNTLAHVNLGRALDKIGKRKEAKEELLIALRLEPDSASTLTGLGTLAVHQGDVSNAVAFFGSALSKQPYYGDAHYNLANLLAREGNLTEAADHYKLALAYNPNAPDAQNNLGAVLLRLNHPKEAIEHFEAALRVKSNNPETQEQLGAAYVQLGQANLALPHYEQAIQLKPDFAYARLKLGQTYAAEGRMDQAIAQFVETAKLEPTNATAFANLGAAYQAINQLDGAAAGFSEAVRLNPKDANTRARLAGVLARQKNYDAAVMQLRQAIDVDPKDARLRANLGAILAAKGDAKKAIDSYRASIDLKPDWPVPRRDLAWIMATSPKSELRNGPEALRQAQKAYELAGHADPHFLTALEVAYAENGRFDDAIKTAQDIQQLATNAAQKSLLIGVSNRINLYRAGKPYRE